MQNIKNKIVQLLRWSEQYTKTDMLYLAKGGFWITFGRMVGAGSGFLLTLILANVISKEAFGTYKFVQSLAGIVTAFSLTGMGTAVIQAVARGNTGALISGFKTFMRWSVLMTIAAWGISIYYFLNGNIMLGWSLFIVGISLPFSQGGGFYDPFLVGRKDFRRDTQYGIIATVVPMIAIGITAVFTEITPLLVLAFFGTSAVVAMILYAHIIKKFKPEQTGSAETLSYGKHLSLMNILGMISTQADRLLVFHYLGALQMALYVIALAVPQQLRFGSKLLAQMALPKFSNSSVADLYHTIPRKALFVLLVSVAIVVFYVLVAPLFFKIFFPQYMDAVLYSQVFSLVILFFPMALFQQFFVSQMEKRKLYVLQIIVPLTKIILLFILLPLFGIWGALMSIFGMEVVRACLILFFFRTAAHQNAIPVVH